MNAAVTSLNLLSNHINESVKKTIQSRFNRFVRKLDFLIAPHVTDTLPSMPIDCSNLKIPQNMQLADSEFHTPGEIDAFFGVQLFYKLLCIGQIKI